MISEAHSEAARINGAKSNGPKTPEGKAASSANSLRHGSTAKAILLTNEEPAKYQKLGEAYYTTLQPTNDVERDIIDEMVISKWLQRRDWSNEAALFDREMDRQSKDVNVRFPKIDHASRYAMAFKALADESKAIQLFIRYETAHRRAFYKALETLLKLRAALNKLPIPVEPEQNQEDSQTQPVEKNFSETNPASNEPPPPEAATIEETTPAADQNPTNRTPERDEGGPR
jgi:hypothetical protein